jgi:superfamily II DNA/RNA helicase
MGESVLSHPRARVYHAATRLSYSSNTSSIGPPNKIQARVLPFMLKGQDVIAQAPPTQERLIS